MSTKVDLTETMIDEAVDIAKHFLDPDYKAPSPACANACGEHAAVVAEQAQLRRLAAHDTLMTATLVRAARNGGMPSKPAGRCIPIPTKWGVFQIPINATTKQLAVVAAVAYIIMRLHGINPAAWMKAIAPASTNAAPAAVTTR